MTSADPDGPFTGTASRAAVIAVEIVATAVAVAVALAAVRVGPVHDEVVVPFAQTTRLRGPRFEA